MINEILGDDGTRTTKTEMATEKRKGRNRRVAHKKESRN